MATPVKNISKKLSAALTKFAATAQFVTITDPASYQQAYHILTQVQKVRRDIEQHYQQIKALNNSFRRGLFDMEKAHLEKIQPAEDFLKRQILQYERLPASTTVDGNLETVTLPENVQQRDHKSVVVEDLQALVQAVAAGDLPLEMLTPNLSALRKMLRQRGALFSVPGCAVKTKTIIVTTSPQ